MSNESCGGEFIDEYEEEQMPYFDRPTPLITFLSER